MLAKKDGEDVIHKATEEVEVTEEKIPQDYLDYLRTIVYKKVDFYEIPPKHIIQHWKDEPNKDRFKGKIIDYKEAIDMSKVTKYKMISIKGDQKEITIDRKDLEKHLKLGYVIKEPLTEEPKNPYAIGMAAAMKATGDTPPLKKSTITKAHKIADKVKEEEVKESTSRNINEGARALVEAIAALQKKADKSGMPYSILKQVYDRGMAAWKGGHRPGAGQHQWAFARVNSFVTKSSGTWGGADSDLAKKVKGKE